MDGEFIEEIDGKGYDGECESIAGGSDYGCYYEHDNEGVAAVASHGCVGEQTDAGSDVADYGEFEHKSHHY